MGWSAGGRSIGEESPHHAASDGAEKTAQLSTRGQLVWYVCSTERHAPAGSGAPPARGANAERIDNMQ